MTDQTPLTSPLAGAYESIDADPGDSRDRGDGPPYVTPLANVQFRDDGTLTTGPRAPALPSSADVTSAKGQPPSPSGQPPPVPERSRPGEPPAEPAPEPSARPDWSCDPSQLAQAPPRESTRTIKCRR